MVPALLLILTARSASPPSHLLHDPLLTWAKSSGIDLAASLTIDSTSSVRGLVTRTPISHGALLATIPRSAILTPYTAHHSGLKDHLPSNDPSFIADLPAPWALAAHLLYEQSLGNDSKWHAYIAALPREQHNLCCLEHDLADLHVSLPLARTRTRTRTNLRDLATSVDAPIYGSGGGVSSFVSEVEEARSSMKGAWTHLNATLFATNRTAFPLHAFGWRQFAWVSVEAY